MCVYVSVYVCVRVCVCVCVCVCVRVYVCMYSTQRLSTLLQIFIVSYCSPFHGNRLSVKYVRFEVLMAASMKFRVFCFHHCPDDGGSTHLLKVSLFQQDYMELHPRRL
jgi:hypothetical protein